MWATETFPTQVVKHPRCQENSPFVLYDRSHVYVCTCSDIFRDFDGSDGTLMPEICR